MEPGTSPAPTHIKGGLKRKRPRRLRQRARRIIENYRSMIENFKTG